MKESSKWNINFFLDAAEKIEVKMQQFVEKFIEILVFSKTDELKSAITALKSVKYSGQAFIESLETWDEQYRRVFDVGYLHALFDMIDLYEKSIHVEREIDKIRTGYRDEIFYFLSRRTTLFHKELASLLRLTPSGLNAVIKLMNAEGIKTVNAEKVSKYTVYSLTPAAYQYAVRHRIYDSHRENNIPGTTVDLLVKGNEGYLGQEKAAFINLEWYMTNRTYKRQDTLFDFAKDSERYKKGKDNSIMTDTCWKSKIAM